MLERIQDVLRNRKQDDRGFSLVELAVVIVVIGILVAIAVPVFLGIQDGANKAQVEAAAANGSAIVAGEIASSPTSTGDKTAIDGKLGSLQQGGITSVTVSASPTLQQYCVTAVGKGYTSTKGTGSCVTETKKS